MSEPNPQMIDQTEYGPAIIRYGILHSVLCSIGSIPYGLVTWHSIAFVFITGG